MQLRLHPPRAPGSETSGLQFDLRVGICAKKKNEKMGFVRSPRLEPAFADH